MAHLTLTRASGVKLGEFSNKRRKYSGKQTQLTPRRGLTKVDI